MAKTRWKKRFTERDVRAAFSDGIIVGIASYEGSYGTEDFMGLDAAKKAKKFLDAEIAHFGSWQDLMLYCGSHGILLNPPKKRKAKAAKAGGR
jgi:hypothetical protein